jgi:predicted RND superfamily exporter protein
MTRIAPFLSERALPLALLFLIIGLWPLSRIGGIRMDNSIDVWLDHQSKEYRDYREFTEEYGSDEWFLIAFSIQDVPREKALADLKALSGDLKETEEGVNALTIANTENPAVPVLKPVLLSEDGKTAGILVLLPKAMEIDRPTLLGRVDTILAPYRSQYTFHLGGPTVVNVELDQASKEQTRSLLGLAFLLSVLGLYWVFRSPGYVLVAIIASGLSVLWTLGIAAASGMTLNMITTVLPILLWVYMLTGSIHVIYHIRLRWKGDVSLNRAILEALQAILFPYSIAYLTTAVGFVSLLTSPMQPVRDLGLYAGIGIGLGFLGNLVLIPGILKALGGIKAGSSVPLKPSSQIPQTGILLIRKWSRAIAPVGVALLLLPIILLSSLKVESNVLTFFKAGSPILTDYQFISANLTGLSTIEVDFQGETEKCFDHALRLVEKIRDLPEIKPIVYPFGSHVRMSIAVKAMESMAFNRLVKTLRARMDSLPAEGVRARLTGTVVLLNQVQEELLHTQIRSFALAFAVIFAIFILIFRSLSLILIGFVVNLLPVAVLFAFLALSRIPLNVATVMIASIAIGIAVDDTVYFLGRFRSELREGGDWEGSIERAYVYLARPMTFTSLVTTLGFLILTLAGFRPISYFGLLGAVTLAAAWAGDVILSPALLYIMPRQLRRL